MEIKTKEELKYIIDFYGIGEITVFEQGDYNKKRLGKLSNDLKYIRNEYGHYLKKEFEYLAVDYVIIFINKFIDKIAKWREIAKQNFETTLMYGSRDEGDHPAGFYTWKSDFTDARVEILSNENGNVRLRGNINQLRKFKEYANNHLRYCGGYYSYDNVELLEWLAIFREFSLFEKYDSFEEYYHGGIVD